MNEKGHIKIYRSITEWEWYRHPNTLALFINCLLSANWKDRKFENQVIPRGSFVTSIKSLSTQTGLTFQQTRTALDHLVSTNNLTNKSYSKYRIITVVNYDNYQRVNKELNNQLTNKVPKSNKQVTTIEEGKNIRREEVCVYNVPPTLTQVSDYCSKNGYEGFDYEKFYYYYQGCGWSDRNGRLIMDWKAKLRYWYKKDIESGKIKKPEDRSRRLD